MENCIFCKIIKKDIPATIIYEDDLITVFEDINPKAPVHILLIPKEHFASLNEIPEDKKELIGHILLKAKGIAHEKSIADKGYRLVLNTGRDSGQDVHHIHFHLLGGRQMSWPPG